jgi:hypothetical protein
MKIFAYIGIFVSMLSVAGMLGLGHFRLYYGPDPVICKVAP